LPVVPHYLLTWNPSAFCPLDKPLESRSILENIHV
jgi:hypothetical protein